MIDGHITGRWILSDEDPAAGTITFTPVLPHRTILTPPGTTGIVSTPIQRTLDEAGYLPITPIAIGRYRVTYDLTVDGGWPSHEIEVTEAHTLEAPLWIPTASPVPTGPGLVQVVSETARIASEIAASHAALEASRAETAALSAWEAVDSPGRQGPRGPEGPQGPPGEVTLAALTTALAGKVTGTGMTLRRDTTVGTRLLLDYPGGTTMLYGDTGWRNIDDLVTTGSANPTQPTKIRRINDQIYFTLIRDAVTVGAGSTILTLPSGWYTGQGNERLYLSGAQGNAPLLFRIIGTPSGLIGTLQPLATGIANVPLTLNANWATTTPWPTTLPGLPS